MHAHTITTGPHHTYAGLDETTETAVSVIVKLRGET